MIFHGNWIFQIIIVKIFIKSFIINPFIYKSFLFISLVLIFRLKLQIMKEKISVIIPTFNRGDLLGNSIKSVLNQTYKNLEVIVVDDGSTDNTKDVVDSFQDQRIKYIKLEENKGGSNARNFGIQNSNGKYISFQDSDDIFYPDKLETQFKNIIYKNSNLDFCKIKVIFNDSYSKFYPNSRQENSISKGDIFNELISKGNFISTQAMLIKRNYMKKYLFDPLLPRLQDFDLILRMIPKVKISYTKKVLVELHIQNDSVTKSQSKLRKAVNILLKKKYNFNSNQKKLFINYITTQILSILPNNSNEEPWIENRFRKINIFSNCFVVIVDFITFL